MVEVGVCGFEVVGVVRCRNCTLSLSPLSEIAPIIGLVMRQIVSGKRKTGEDLRGHGSTRWGRSACVRMCARVHVSVCQGCNYQVFAQVRWIFPEMGVVRKAFP